MSAYKGDFLRYEQIGIRDGCPVRSALRIPLLFARKGILCVPEDCACILSSSPPCKIVLPLAILCLRTIVNTLPPREAVSSRLNLTTICGTHIKVTDSFLSATSKGRLTVKLKTKKQHEIDRLVNFIKVLKSTHLGESFHFIVDIGAGMGHLSRILSVSLPDCSIIAVEKNDDLVKKSILLNEKLRRRCNSSDNLEHRCELVEAAFHGLDIPDLSSDQKALLIGLHPCGDLSSSILRLFVGSQNMAALILFGCCYHKLSVTDKEQHDCVELR